MNDHELARKLARDTGELLVGLRNHAHSLTKLDDEMRANLATEILGSEGDLIGNEYLLEQLAKHRPDDIVLSEEGDHEVARIGAKRVWIIDPLDGTSQFETGGDDFAVHVALWEAGSEAPAGISVASVAVPTRNQVLSMDDPTVSKSQASGPIRILVSRSRPPREIEFVKSELEAKFPDRGKVEIVPMGSVGAKVAEIISGGADIYLNTGGFYEWDLAAPLGVAIHNGLSVTDCYGKKFELNQPNLRIADVLISRPEFVDVVVSALAAS
jgi:3'(2'), 5'-bisphosphate nucleotidase